LLFHSDSTDYKDISILINPIGISSSSTDRVVVAVVSLVICTPTVLLFPILNVL